MIKEKSDKHLTIRVPESLVVKFQAECNKNYKTMSEAMRDLMQKYIKEGNC